MSMQIGIILFIRLVLACQLIARYRFLHSDLFADLGALPVPESARCNLLSEAICRVTLRDNFTVVLTIWTTLQLTWVTMLLFVQCVQIARAITTYESMRGLPDHSSRASEAITAAITSGSISMEGAQLPSGHSEVGHHGHAHREGVFGQFKKLLGLDTFMATAQSEIDRGSSQRRRNPYSRGVITNCRDFWCDPAPIFGKRETGAAMLDGEVVNYVRIYELPPRTKRQRARIGDEEALYQSVGVLPQ